MLQWHKVPSIALGIAQSRQHHAQQQQQQQQQQGADLEWNLVILATLTQHAPWEGLVCGETLLCRIYWKWSCLGFL